ncbi:HAD family hydrolase [Candidatus Vidania fulgoroideorum]
MKDGRKLLIFDLDRTLINKDCEKELVIHLYRDGLIKRRMYRKGMKFYNLYSIGAPDHKGYIKYISQIFNIILEKKHKLNKYYRYIISHVNKKVYGLLKRCQKEGDDVVVSTSSHDFLVTRIMKILNIKNYISNRIVTRNNRYIGRLLGARNSGVGKVHHLIRWIGSGAYNNIIFYTDSINDLPLIMFANRSYTVNPDRYLIRLGKISRLE